MVELCVGKGSAIQDMGDVCQYITDEKNGEEEWQSEERVNLSAIVQQAINDGALVAANLGGATPSTAKKAGSVSLPDEQGTTKEWLQRDHERVRINHHRAKENSPPPTGNNLSPSPADSMLTMRQLEFTAKSQKSKSQKSKMCAAEKVPDLLMMSSSTMNQPKPKRQSLDQEEASEGQMEEEAREICRDETKRQQFKETERYKNDGVSLKQNAPPKTAKVNPVLQQLSAFDLPFGRNPIHDQEAMLAQTMKEWLLEFVAPHDLLRLVYDAHFSTDSIRRGEAVKILAMIQANDAKLPSDKISVSQLLKGWYQVFLLLLKVNHPEVTAHITKTMSSTRNTSGFKSISSFMEHFGARFLTNKLGNNEASWQQLVQLFAAQPFQQNKYAVQQKKTALEMISAALREHGVAICANDLRDPILKSIQASRAQNPRIERFAIKYEDSLCPVGRETTETTESIVQSLVENEMRANQQDGNKPVAGFAGFGKRTAPQAMVFTEADEPLVNNVNSTGDATNVSTWPKTSAEFQHSNLCRRKRCMLLKKKGGLALPVEERSRSRCKGARVSEVHCFSHQLSSRLSTISIHVQQMR